LKKDGFLSRRNEASHGEIMEWMPRQDRMDANQDKIETNHE
jgi:hypothetical protein